MPLPLRSLKLRLLLPYAALIVLLTSFIGGMTYLAGTRTVTDLSDHLLQEMAARLRQSIQHHVGGSAAVLEAVFPYGMAAEPDIRTNWLALRNRLWAATTLHPRSNDYVHYGNVSGQNVGLKRLPDGSAELRIRTDAQQHRSFYRLDSIDGQQQFVRTERSLFDPRTRPWFQQAARAEQHTWTSVYLDLGLPGLQFARSGAHPCAASAQCPGCFRGRGGYRCLAARTE